MELTGLIFMNARFNTSILNARSKLLSTMLLLTLLHMLSVSCSGTTAHDLDKQAAFEANFSPGMTEEEVVDILKTIGDYRLTDTRQLENGDVILTFRTGSGEWGSPVYYFRFSPDHELMVLFPPTV